MVTFSCEACYDAYDEGGLNCERHERMIDEDVQQQRGGLIVSFQQIEPLIGGSAAMCYAGLIGSSMEKLAGRVAPASHWRIYDFFLSAMMNPWEEPRDSD